MLAEYRPDEFAEVVAFVTRVSQEQRSPGVMGVAGDSAHLVGVGEVHPRVGGGRGVRADVCPRRHNDVGDEIGYRDAAAR